MSSNHYQTLQLTPDASQEQIELAYQQLAQQYSATSLAELAPDIKALAVARQRDLAQAYHILSDPVQRERYDRERHQDQDDEIDYRPLAPRRAAPRPVRPIASDEAGPARPRPLLATLVVGALAAMVIALALLMTAKERGMQTLTTEQMLALAAQPTLPPAVTAQITDTAVLEVLSQQQQVIERRRQQAEGSGAVQDWISLGNSVFDYLETIREQSAEGPAYQAVAERWVEAAQAYASALDQQPRNGLVRSDYAMSLLRLAQRRQDQQLLDQALAEAQQALSDDPQGLRTLLNVAIVFDAGNPPRPDEARTLLETIIARAPESVEGVAARLILEGGAR